MPPIYLLMATLHLAVHHSLTHNQYLMVKRRTETFAFLREYSKGYRSNSHSESVTVTRACLLTTRQIRESNILPVYCVFEMKNSSLITGIEMSSFSHNKVTSR